MRSLFLVVLMVCADSSTKVCAQVIDIAPKTVKTVRVDAKGRIIPTPEPSKSASDRIGKLLDGLKPDDKTSAKPSTGKMLEELAKPKTDDKTPPQRHLTDLKDLGPPISYSKTQNSRVKILVNENSTEPRCLSVKDSIENDVISKVEERLKDVAANDRYLVVPKNEYNVSLKDIFTTSRQTDELISCHATLEIVATGIDPVSQELMYDVIKTEDGNVLFRITNRGLFKIPTGYSEVIGSFFGQYYRTVQERAAAVQQKTYQENQRKLADDRANQLKNQQSLVASNDSKLGEFIISAYKKCEKDAGFNLPPDMSADSFRYQLMFDSSGDLLGPPRYISRNDFMRPRLRFFVAQASRLMRDCDLHIPNDLKPTAAQWKTKSIRLSP